MLTKSSLSPWVSIQWGDRGSCPPKKKNQVKFAFCWSFLPIYWQLRPKVPLHVMCPPPPFQDRLTPLSVTKEMCAQDDHGGNEVIHCTFSTVLYNAKIDVIESVHLLAHCMDVTYCLQGTHISVRPVRETCQSPGVLLKTHGNVPGCLAAAAGLVKREWGMRLKSSIFADGYRSVPECEGELITVGWRCWKE